MTTLINLTQFTLIEATGLDAEKFLQGQLTTDVTKLAVGDSTITAHCDAKGKMTSIFRLMRIAEQQFYLLFRTELLPFALDQLKKYAVFSKVSFTPLNVQIVGIIGENCGEISANFNVKLANAELLINPKDNLEFNGSVVDWDLFEIQQGMPILSAKTQSEFIPQAVNLQCVEHAISFQKGCYIGQETIARAKYRGANKRAMHIFTAKTEFQPEIGSEIEMQLASGWRATGTILSAVHSAEILWLQVVLNHPLEEGQQFRLTTDHSILERQPLPYDLN
ncbi:CAF17-like 4Fe-4S cluster assembly/insertion protein YgfZ [Pasteurella bettyae]|uniref:Folate-binding protein YgfZ n=1 Tax=Pasteurella bettyae CCUG 2042 TaxID=1095749 RepID=I3D6G3_9PAST|nr:folate-binding protein YgfZ [Pasteurella bettyae]EIJ67306.1 folate-binding protein YgfZ [Pasteurella bettyae CCUG 2042]SUB21301.1 glycine cleavage T-protein family protein [Pasteurella bettyae]